MSTSKMMPLKIILLIKFLGDQKTLFLKLGTWDKTKSLRKKEKLKSSQVVRIHNVAIILCGNIIASHICSYLPFFKRSCYRSRKSLNKPFVHLCHLLRGDIFNSLNNLIWEYVFLFIIQSLHHNVDDVGTFLLSNIFAYKDIIIQSKIIVGRPISTYSKQELVLDINIRLLLIAAIFLQMQ